MALFLPASERPTSHLSFFPDMKASIAVRFGFFCTMAVLQFSSAFYLRGQGIPEPDLVMYGTVLNISSNANLRLAYGTLTCVFRRPGGLNPITVSTSLTNINNRFSYIL